MDAQKRVRRLSHYRSDMHILLVGEGDFSFAAALARAFHYAPCLRATSLDSREMLHIKYGELIMERRLDELGARGVVVLNEVDVKTVLQNPSLCHLSFNRIVYNFPHSGFLPGVNEQTKSLIKKHRELMRAFFKSASRLLKEGGEVHVVQHMCRPYSEWRLEEEAAKSGLKLRTHLPFKARAFSGYESRRGDGDNANGTFIRHNPVTFIFCLPKSSPSSLALTLPSHPPPSIIGLPVSAHTSPLHSPSPHTKRSPSQKKPPPSSKAHSVTSQPSLPRTISPTSPILSSYPPTCKISPPLSNKPSLSQAISSRPCHVHPHNAPPLKKPQPSISNPCLIPRVTLTINPVSLVALKPPPHPRTPCITSFSPQHPSHASNITITLSNPSASSSSDATAWAPTFTSSQGSYTNTSSKHQLISSCKQMGSHKDPYKLDHPPTLNSLSHGEYYRLPNSDDHNLSELHHPCTVDSSSCTSFLMWMMSFCTSCKVGSLT